MNVYKRGIVKNIVSNGFTTIELVVTILILSILAATILPRLSNSSDFEEYAYRTEVISTLRTVQLRAMQQTQSNLCHKVKLTSLMLGLVATDNSADNCDDTSWFDSANYNLSTEDGPTSVQIDSNHSVTFSTGEIVFDQMGRPSGCGSPCSISIVGAEQTLTVVIEPEGYIHAG